LEKAGEEGMKILKYTLLKPYGMARKLYLYAKDVENWPVFIKALRKFGAFVMS
jgi:hypothetical protein